jgi:SOS-response transcriptional repressor LexA
MCKPSLRKKGLVKIPLTPQEMDLCDAVKAAIATSGRSYEEIASALGMTRFQLSNVANKRTHPKPAFLDALRRELGKPPTWPYDTLAGSPKPGQRVSLAGTALVGVKVIGTVSAGGGIWNVDVERRTVYVPEQLAKLGDVGFIIDGDSMMPFLHEGDTAVFAERRKPRHGFPFLVRMPDRGDKVKFMVYDRGEWYMVSLNPAYPPERLADGAEIIGILMGFYRVEGTEEIMRLNSDGLRGGTSTNDLLTILRK